MLLSRSGMEFQRNSGACRPRQLPDSRNQMRCRKARRCARVWPSRTARRSLRRQSRSATCHSGSFAEPAPPAPETQRPNRSGESRARFLRLKLRQCASRRIGARVHPGGGAQRWQREGLRRRVVRKKTTRNSRTPESPKLPRPPRREPPAIECPRVSICKTTAPQWPPKTWHCWRRS